MNFVTIPLRIILFGLFSFFLLRIGLYSIQSEYFSLLDSHEVFKGFIKGVQFDSATLMLFSAPFLLLLSFPFKWIYHSKVRSILIWLNGFVLLLLFTYSLGDIAYFGEVQRHIGAEILNLSADTGALLDIALDSRLSFTFISLLFLLALSLLWYRFVIRPSQSFYLSHSHWITKLIAWLFLIALYVFLTRGMIINSRPINLSDAFTGSKLPQAYLALNPVYTSYREINTRLKQQPLAYVSSQELKQFAEKTPDIFKWQNPQNLPTKKNIVLILLESWSYKYIDGLSGSNYKATPFFDSLIAKSQVWDNYYAAGQRSIIGIQAILSSMPALSNHPTLGFGLELTKMSRIADIAGNNGYRTIMAQSSGRRSFHMNSIANALGFQEYYGKEDVPLLRKYPQATPRFGWDYDTLQFFYTKLDENTTKPFFSFLFTGTTHEPFPKLDPEFEIYPHDSQNQNGFLNSLKYSDWALQQFMQKAEKQDWYHNTIFIFTADHTLNAQSTDALNQKYHIPLLIFAPDGSLPPKRDNRLSSQYDLFPTIMDLLGFSQPIYTFGKSLYSEDKSDYLFLNQGDTSGMISKTGWLSFTTQGIQEQSANLTDDDKKALENLKLKLQYADELIRENRWVLSD